MKSFAVIFEESNTFTHDGHDYSLTALNKVVKGNPVEDIEISKLTWIFKFDNPLKDHPERIKTAALSNPILVTKWGNKIVILDGLHRVKKAQMQGQTKVPAKDVSASQLAKSRLN